MSPRYTIRERLDAAMKDVDWDDWWAVESVERKLVALLGKMGKLERGEAERHVRARGFFGGLDG